MLTMFAAGMVESPGLSHPYAVKICAASERRQQQVFAAHLTNRDGCLSAASRRFAVLY